MNTQVTYYETKQQAGLLYRVPLNHNDIRITFQDKCNWIGPEELRLRQLMESGAAYV